MIAAAALALAFVAAQEAETKRVDTSLAATATAIERGTAYLLANQNADGSWGGPNNPAHEFWSNPETHRAWTVATTGLAVIALLEDAAPDSKKDAAADRGLDYVVANAGLQRPSDWDIDNTWGYVYGLQALARAIVHPRIAPTPRAETFRKTGAAIAESLKRYQSPNGGWGYYANPDAGWRPEWATSFMTAVGVLALVDARAAGIAFDEPMVEKAVRALERCRLPNGAYSYDVMALPRVRGLEDINDVKGSLGRIQVCNLALVEAGSKKVTEADLRAGLDLFFKHHKFLDVARMRPIPHEAYYYNAAYFYFFGHYYASLVLERLPQDVRAPYAEPLRREVLKTIDPDGSMWDFYLNSYHRPYGTSFGVMTLRRAARTGD